MDVSLQRASPHPSREIRRWQGMSWFSRSGRLGSLILLALLSAEVAPALQVRGFNASRHERFTGFPSAPVRNPAFLHAALDLSGVGWSVEDPQKQFTLISPLHFAGANHFRPSLNSMLGFVADDGTVVTRQVTALTAMLNDEGLPTDVLIGTLGGPVNADSGVRFLPYLNLDTDAGYVGKSLIVLGRSVRGGIGTLATVSDFGNDPATSGAGINTTRAFTFNYLTFFGGADDAYAEGGDSGSPALTALGGRAALVGMHMAVGSTPGTITTFDSLLPFYADRINDSLSADGYHLTQATPKAVTPTLSQQAPSSVRAGYPFTLVLPVGNPSPVNEAHNLKLSQEWSVAPTQALGAGPLWVREPAQGSGVQARRGGLVAGLTTEFSVSGILPVPGMIRSTAQLKADGTAAITSVIDLRVVESYRSWSRDLTLPGATEDPDLDGVDNLSEYAFGGDPVIPSQFRSGTTLPLGPKFLEGNGPVGTTVSWLQRRDAAERALGYVLQRSTGLSEESWMDLTPETITASLVDDDFELMTATLPADPSGRIFIRVRIVLKEAG